MLEDLQNSSRAHLTQRIWTYRHFSEIALDRRLKWQVLELDMHE